MTNNMNITIVGELWAAFLCFMAYLVMALYRKKTTKDTCVRRMLLICILLMVSDAATWYFDGLSGSNTKIILYLSNYLVYASSYLIVGMFVWYLWQMARRRDEQVPVLFKVFWGGVTASVAALTIGIFFNFYFYIDELNVYHRTSAYPFSQLITVLGVTTLLWSTFRYGRRLSRFENIATGAYVILPPLGTVIQAFHYGVACQQFAFAVATLITFFVREADVRRELQETTNRELEGRRKLQEANKEQEEQLKKIVALNESLVTEQKAKEREHIIVDALSASYLNVYIINVAAQTVEILKLNGYVTRGLSREKVGPYPYEATCQTYIRNRVYVEDQHMVAAYMRLENLLTQLKEQKEYEFTYRVPENGEISFYQGKYVAVDEGYIVCGFQNIDAIVKKEIKQKEELKQARDLAEAANRAKSSFLFNMSHDIRTPMNAILGFTDLMEKNYDNREKCMDYLHKTQEANKFLLSLINNVLEMARIESGKEKLDETVCATGVVTHEMISIFEEQMRQKNISFTSNVAIHTPYMLCDQPKLREICLNILSNAVKYTPEGGSIHIDMLEQPCERPGYARICGMCADTGIGMSKEFLPHLFEEFAREQTATESRQQGTGLGMPIVKKLVDLMGGAIEVESEPGKGTTFKVTIDLKIADVVPEAKPESTDTLADVDFEGKRILLAEDNDLNAEIAIEILSEVGIEVERAADGIICVDMLQKAEPGYYDLILMDIQMPNMDGYKATQMIRSMNDPHRSQIPIFAMTANAFDEDRKNALASGMNGHLAKPIEIPKLMETLASILR